MRIQIIFLVLFLSVQTIATGQQLPEYFYITEFDFTLDRPVGMRFMDNGAAFIFGKKGVVWALDSLGNLQSEPVLDISEEVTDWSDHGLVSMALDPNFPEKPFLYLYYTVDRHHLVNFGTPAYDPSIDLYNQASIGRVSRFEVSFEEGKVIGDASSQKIIFGKNWDEGNPILMGSHGVGSVVFGGDGSMLISCGDGGSYTEVDMGNAEDTFHDQAIEDGMITGDENVGSFRAMLKNSLAGKILRIDPETGEGISNNPFYEPTNPNSKRSKVWSMGFRNPYKFVYINGTSSHEEDGDFPGKFLVGDVGSSLYEELNLINQPGQWYGWPKFEGVDGNWHFGQISLKNPEAPNPRFGEDCGDDYYFFRDLVYHENASDSYIFNLPCDGVTPMPEDFPRFVHRRPILAYSNDLWNPPAKTKIPTYDEEGKALNLSADDPQANIDGELIEGGSAMPGDFCAYDYFPEEYRGKLFLIDYHGWINVIGFDENYAVNEVKRFTILKDRGITDLQFNPMTGQLFYVDFAKGKIHTIEYGGTRPPQANITVDKNYGLSPLTITFDASSSKVYDGSNASYTWDFGDGEMSNEEKPVHNFEQSGNTISNFEVRLMVADSSGAIDETSLLVSLNNTPPSVDISSLEDGDYYSISATNILPLKANVVDAENQADELEYRWQVVLHHDDHTHPGPINNEQESLAFLEPAGCGQETFFYSVMLEVEDGHGLVGKDSLGLQPYCGEAFTDLLNLEANYNPDGVLLQWDEGIIGDVDYYIVEHTQGFNFLEIGRVSASSENRYEYLHDNAMNGLHYYRIRAVSKSGVPEYSNVVNINYVQSFSYTVAPNPVQRFLLVKIQHQDIQDLSFDLFSIEGVLVRSYSSSDFHGSQVQNYDFNLDVSELPSAPYLYRIRVNDEKSSGRIMKF